MSTKVRVRYLSSWWQRLAVGIALFISCAVSYSNECFKAPREIGVPTEGLIYRSELSAASVGSPSTIDFRSSEQFMLTIVRTPVGSWDSRSAKIAPVGLVILLREPSSGQLEVYCEMDSFELDVPFRDARYFIFSPLAKTREWRIQIVDHGSPLKPEYGRQDPISVQIIKFPNANVAEDAYGKSNIVRGSLNIACDSFFAQTDKFMPNGPVRQEMTVGPSLRSFSFFLRSSGPVQVEFHPDPTTIPQQSTLIPPQSLSIKTLPSISVAAKEDGPGPFEVGCSQSPVSGAGSFEAVEFTLTRPYQFAAPPLWRVEVNAANNINFNTKVVLRYPGDMPSVEPFPTELQCAPPNASRAMTVSSNAKPFAGATILQVALKDPENLLSTAARDDITKHLLQGMALWRPICYLCTPDQLVLARVDGKTYVLQSLLEALDKHYSRVASGTGILLEQVSGKYGELVSSLGARYHPRGRESNFGYVELLEPNASLQALCKENFDGMPVSLQRIRNAVGCEIDRERFESKTVRASTQLIFRTTTLDGCPSGINTVACESSALKIEFNAKDYKFVSHFGRVKIVGNGQREADLLHVLTHEIGHWIGIGHLAQRGSLMSESMSGSRCIDTAAANALNILVAGGDFPVSEPKALLWDEPFP
ncbi:MAG: matrixin family metalloprotease [Pseudomonadota bacterium]